MFDKGWRWSYNPLRYIKWVRLRIKHRKSKWKSWFIPKPIVITDVTKFLNCITERAIKEKECLIELKMK